jgi:hypothetical protein
LVPKDGKMAQFQGFTGTAAVGASAGSGGHILAMF